MFGGEIVIQGDVGPWAGCKMSGGEIVVHGDAEVAIGIEMTDGVIELHGQYRSLSPLIRGGRVYHKGKLIFENGTHIDES